jgi:transcriptional regulator with XRE-family HTH domain
MKNAIEMMESKMSPEAVQKSRAMAEQEILSIRLKALREKLGKKQDDFLAFSQTSISRLENRTDIRISTLIEYLNDMGMGLEIKTYPKDTNYTIGEEVLLKV